jgi:phosphatidylinositol glycan class B
LLIAIAGIYAAYFLHLQFKFKDALSERIHLLLSLFTWALVYAHVRYSSENLSGIFLILGTAFLLKEISIKHIFLGFLTLGLAFESRYQTGFYIAGIGLYLLFKNQYKLKEYFAAMAGILLAIVLGTLLDCLFYQSLVFAPWNYLHLNIFQKLAASFGSEPWYWYLLQINEKLIPPFGLAILAGLVLSIRKSNYRMIGMGILFFLLGHCLVGHKEFRFLFPVAYFMPLLWVLVYEKLKEVFTGNSQKILRVIYSLFWIVNTAALCLVSLSPAHQILPLLKAINTHIPENAKLIYTDEHPFYSGQNKNSFYLNSHIEFENLEKDSSLPIQSNSNQALYFVCNSFEEPAYLTTYQNKELLYSTFPDWMKIVNINGWMNRSNCYQLYKLK